MTRNTFLKQSWLQQNLICNHKKNHAVVNRLSQTDASKYIYIQLKLNKINHLQTHTYIEAI